MLASAGSDIRYDSLEANGDVLLSSTNGIISFDKRTAAGQLYRSNQPSVEELVRYTKENGIRTVINLRGTNESQAWYQDEIKTSRELGLNHIDFGMSASKELDMNQVNQLVAIMRDAPKPILIHCKARQGGNRLDEPRLCGRHQVAA